MAFSGISVLRAPDAQDRPCVAVIISREFEMTTAEGDRYPGVALDPKRAKLLAYRMLAIAAEIEAEGG